MNSAPTRRPLPLPAFPASVFTAITLAMLAAVSSAWASIPLWQQANKQNREWVAICPIELQGEVARLRDFRISQGHSACIWTLQDLDVTYGGHGPEQIRQGLLWAVGDWWQKPKWILLVGDHQANGGPGDVISDWKLYNPELGHWEDYIRGLWPYMDVDDDSIPDVAVGRIAVSNAQETANYVAKVIAHDSDLGRGVGYAGSAMLLQDMNLNGNDASWVTTLGDSLFNDWMPSPDKQMLRMSSTGCCQVLWESAARQAWNTGPGQVVALGTGSNWFQLVGFFNLCGSYPWSIYSMAATGTYPALLGLSCGINATDQVITSSCDDRGTLVGHLLFERPDAGASVVIGPMRNTIQWWDYFVGKHLLARKNAGDLTWGEVFKNAMGQAIADDPGSFDHVFQYVLAGDPAVWANPNGLLAAPNDPASPGVRGPFPNPALQRASVAYRLASRSRVQLDVCDVAGRRIRLLADRTEDPGAYVVAWDLRDGHGMPVSPGAYFVNTRIGERRTARRLVVVR